MDQSPSRILIYGAGAVGQALGAMLAARGHRVDLVLRERYRAPLAADGITVTGIFGDFHALPGSFGIVTSIDEIPDRQYDFAVITTKSYDTATAIDALAVLDETPGRIVSLQNGCGNLEQVAARFGKTRTLAGRVITGFEITRPGVVRITVTADDIHIGGYAEGALSADAEVFAAMIADAGLPCVATATIRRDLYAKLLYNCALNPLGAILGVHYGALGDSPAARAVMDTVIQEVFAVLDAMGETTHWTTPEEYREVFYERLLPATYHHRPSMLQDLGQGKRTEVDALTGYVSEQGRLSGVDTPVCDTLSSQVRFLESMHAARSTGVNQH